MTKGQPTTGHPAVRLRPVDGDGAGRRYGRQEWAVDPGRPVYANPDDPDEVTVDATFTAADGHRLVVPAFWDERPGGTGFYVRMAPDAAGAWRARVTVKDRAGTRSSDDVAFTVADSDRPGFVRVAANRRYLRFDSGASYFPVGLNLCWPDPGGGAGWYEQAFATLSGHGGNYARVWMASEPHKLEDRRTGLGRYSLSAAAFYDAVLDAADRHGIGVMLCFLNHREFLDRDMWGEAEWPANPYNAAAGGPADVFTDPNARRLFRNRLRYIVARYSAYTSVAPGNCTTSRRTPAVRSPRPGTRKWRTIWRTPTRTGI